MLEPSRLLPKQVIVMLQMCTNWNPDSGVVNRHPYRHGGLYEYWSICRCSVLRREESREGGAASTGMGP